MIWNRYGTNHELAKDYERAGARVLVCENGYLGADEQQRQFYAIARNGHNGSGSWPYDGRKDVRPAPVHRWEKLGIDVQPWREPPADGYLLVCGQRGIGSPEMASPPGWHEAVIARLRRVTKTAIKVRSHPGNDEPVVPLEKDLAGALGVVVWSSSVAGKALLKGIRCWYDAPHHVLGGAMERVAELELLLRSGNLRQDLFSRFGHERRPWFARMAWAQWSVEEIERGEPFEHLLSADTSRQGKV